MLFQPPMYISPGCVVLGSRYFPLFWLGTDPPVLVEGGVSAVVPGALEQLKTLALPSPAILVLLHEHNDHVLGTSPLASRLTGLSILASAKTVELLKKEKVMNSYRETDRFFTRVLESHGEGKECPWEGFPEVVPLEEASLPPGLHILSTPGHSPGSMALFWEDEGVLFVSDSLGYYSSRDRHFPLYFQSLELYLESIETMSSTRPQVLALGHLQFFSGGEVERIFWRSKKEALRLAERVKKAGDKALDMVFRTIRQDELITFYTQETIQECARYLVKRSLET